MKLELCRFGYFSWESIGEGVMFSGLEGGSHET